MGDLLAKSDGTLLPVHADAVEVCSASVATTFGLHNPEQSKLSGRLHDTGKGARFFQDRMLGRRRGEQYRHELFSFAFAYASAETLDLDIPTLAAILTHHRNIDDDCFSAWLNCNFPVQERAGRLRDLLEAQLRPHWTDLAVAFPELVWPTDHSSCVIAMSTLYQSASRYTVWMPEGFELAMCRGALVAADHLASSGIAESVSPGENVRISPLIDYMRAHVDGWHDWRQLQKDAQVEGNLMLVAPTGSGKTEAAILWALRNRRKSERIFYVLPYRVSINAMAQRLAEVFPDHGPPVKLRKSRTIAILHGNSDLAYLYDALEDADAPVARSKVDSWARERAQAARKIYSPVKVTTVYQLLEIFFGRKFYEVGLLELSDALVIFDEIHAYDGHTQGLILVLLEYLQRLGARMLIMTATLPEKMRRRLAVAAGNCKEAKLRKKDPHWRQAKCRIVRRDGLLEDNVQAIREAVEGGARTAVVCNTVGKAVALYGKLRKLEPLLIHSRFSLSHRALRETKRNVEGYRLVISTQVIEVSLDVSFDVMFTELAPADSLIQRCGRVNRYGLLSKLAPCHVFVGEDEGSRRIYDTSVLDATRNSMPEGRLDFRTCCEWVEAVYPEGLTKKEMERCDSAEHGFRGAIENLHPMMDPHVDPNLERTLLQSVTVIPRSKLKRWCQLKRSKQHTSAKGVTVQVSLPSWKGALQGFSGGQLFLIWDERAKQYELSTAPPQDGRRYELVANFEYWRDMGLRLDRPVKRLLHDTIM